MNRKTKIYKIVNLLFQGLSDIEIRNQLDIPERTYFRWKHRIDEEGLHSVINKRLPGRKPSFEISNEVSRKIIEWRKRYGWGPTRIEGHLKAHHNIHVPHNQIHKIFVKNKLNNPIPMPRKYWGKGRFQRLHSMSLLQADFKLIDSNDQWMLTFIDDHSRFVVYSEVLDNNPTMEIAMTGVETILKTYGNPVQILTDNGTQFANNHGEAKTEFTLLCESNGIQHLLTSKKRPTTIGKLENFHGQYEKEAWRFTTHNRYIRYWNYKRPHGAIGYLFPYEVFVRDRRQTATIPG